MEFRGVSQVGMDPNLQGLNFGLIWRYIVVGSIASGGLAMFCMDHCLSNWGSYVSSVPAGDIGVSMLYK